MFYANVVAMDLHPGNQDRSHTLADCARIADLMLEEYLCRFSQQELVPSEMSSVES